MSGIGVLAALLGIILGGIVAGLLIAFVVVPLMRGVGWLIVSFFKAIGWLIAHVFEYIGGTIGDALRLISAIIAGVVLLPFAPINVVLGRWSAAGHFAESIKRECRVATACLYRILLRRPLKLLWLHGILEGVEQRLPEAMAAAPATDRPSRRAGQFDGYRIVGSLPGGGSGAKLYIAEPETAKRARNQAMPDRVVIKSFTLTEGSTLPQIVRESRALDAARQLGLVLDHGLDRQRFFYVMPYHAGDHLGIVTRQLHGESESDGLDARGCRTVLGHAIDLAETLAMYHEGGLWHKDVKPDNIIVRDGRAHLVDLGLVTPLRSAMTLTTHGTEYFRDPEMVRQALRGVKVHQVDGAKFDIYAVGAVLYFMLENTFPAHGALSRFAKRSPESVRWIVRRAMAEYNQRYGSAQEMLSDLRAVAAAPDAAAVRPADLPSMGGRPATSESETAWNVAAAPAAVAAAAIPSPSVPSPEPQPHGPAPRPRPKLRVTNWWTGAYMVDEGANDAMAAREFSRHASEMRRGAAGRRDKVRSGSLSPRGAAREQIREARARAQEMRRRARTGRPRAIAEHQPSRALGGAVLVFLLLGTAFTIFVTRRHNGRSTMVQVVDTTPGRLQLKAGDGDPLVLVVDGGDISSSGAREQIKRFVATHDLQGRGVMWIDGETNDTLTGLLRTTGQGQPVPVALAEHIRGLSGSGALWVKVDRDSVTVRDLVLIPPVALPVIAELPTGIVIDGPIAEASSDRPLLLVNDHPVKSHPQVERAVNDLVERYRSHQWNVVVDDEAEARVRQVLPAGPIDPTTHLPRQLQAVLVSLHLAGVLKIDAAPGDGPAYERMRWTQVDTVADAAVEPDEPNGS